MQIPRKFNVSSVVQLTNAVGFVVVEGSTLVVVGTQLGAPDAALVSKLLDGVTAEGHLFDGAKIIGAHSWAMTVC